MKDTGIKVIVGKMVTVGVMTMMLVVVKVVCVW